MSEQVFQRVLVPVASTEDADMTARALLPHVRDRDASVILVHVIEKAGGAPDKASVEQRELRAENIFEAATERLQDADMSVTTRIAYGTDIARAIIDTAAEVDASVIAFTPRGGSRWVKLLTGDVALSLLMETDRPVVTLPAPDDA